MLSKLRMAFAFIAAASLVTFVAFYSQGESGPAIMTRHLWFPKLGIQDAKARLLTDKGCINEPTKNFASPVFIDLDATTSRLVLLIKILSSVNEFVEDWECYLNTLDNRGMVLAYSLKTIVYAGEVETSSDLIEVEPSSWIGELFGEVWSIISQMSLERGHPVGLKILFTADHLATSSSMTSRRLRNVPTEAPTKAPTLSPTKSSTKSPINSPSFAPTTAPVGPYSTTVTTELFIISFDESDYDISFPKDFFFSITGKISESKTVQGMKLKDFKESLEKAVRVATARFCTDGKIVEFVLKNKKDDQAIRKFRKFFTGVWPLGVTVVCK